MPQPTRTSLLAQLKEAQEQHGWLSPEVMTALAERHRISESRLYGIATFYSLLRTEPRGRFIIRLCNSASCRLGGVGDLVESTGRVLGIRPGETTPDKMFSMEVVSCLGACGSGPAAMINDRLYTHLDPGKLATIVSDIKDGRMPHANVALGDEAIRAIGEPVLVGDSVPELEELLSRFEPAELLALVEESGLSGRGGAAFPTGRKWRLCSESPGDEKFVVCNADEGEPGTFKDRYLLTRRPELVVAGMILAGRAVGARKGYVYLRGEYTDAREVLKQETSRTGSPDFNIELIAGAGAYVCGEETALLESMEGGRGVPRLRPPYPPVSGLFGKPTVINNVETLANVPLILARGADWYRSLGTVESPGTKLFSLSGDIERPGIIEAPLGISLHDILSEAGAGKLKAALVGGASGCLIPPAEFGRRLCWEDLHPGAGAIVAIGNHRPIRDLAENLMAFFEHESCGECAPCRIGTSKAVELLADRHGTEGPSSETLRTLCDTLADASRCGLGRTASAALLDALRLFPEEFES